MPNVNFYHRRRERSELAEVKVIALSVCLSVCLCVHIDNSACMTLLLLWGNATAPLHQKPLKGTWSPKLTHTFYPFSWKCRILW